MFVFLFSFRKSKRKKRKIKNIVFLLILCILFIILYDIFKDVWGINYQELIGCEYCDWFEETVITNNNNNNFSNKDDIIIGSEDNNPPVQVAQQAKADHIEQNIKHALFSVKMYKYYKTLKDKSKRKLFRVMWESHKDKYSSYKEFKDYWDFNQSIWDEIKKDLKEKKDKIRLHNRTLIWILRPSIRNRHRKHGKG